MKGNQCWLQDLLQSYSKEFKPFVPFPKRTDRAAWQAVPQAAQGRILQSAEENLNYVYPLLPTSLYLSFVRTGNRSTFQGMYFARRRVLNDFVLAECFENKGRFVDDIINGFMLICEESGWQIPAHNRKGSTNDRNPIADVENPLIDLYSGETAAQLAMIVYLFEDVLSAQSPLFVKRIKKEIQQRIEIPYLTKTFFWTGKEGQRLNNWTTWCTMSVLISLLLLDEISQDTKREVMQKACRSLDLFIASYDDDGFCDEGASYYHGASIALFQAIAVLNQVTSGHFASVYQNPKIKNMATYIMDVHIADNMYANYADCSCKLVQPGSKKYLAARAIGSQEMMQYAAQTHMSVEGKADIAGINLYARVESLLLENEMNALRQEKRLTRPDRYFEDAGVLIARDERFFMAVIGGDSADPHGHNDKGNVIVFKNGKPLLIDAGVEAYTKKTFSPERYTLWTMRSSHHNVMNFGDVEQAHGAEYYASVLEEHHDETVASITLALEHAYQESAVEQYHRKVTLEKGKQLIVQDTLSAVPPNTYLSLMTQDKPTYQDGTLSLAGESIVLEGVSLNHIETIVLQDEKTKKDWGDCIYRTQLNVISTQVTFCIPF